MSMYPFYMEFDRPTPPRRLLEQQVGRGFAPHDYLTLLGNAVHGTCNHSYYQPWRNMVKQDVDSESFIEDRDKFQVNIDVPYFRAADLTVKIADGCLIIQGKHDERADFYGHISRNFTRRYPLPEGANPDMVTSTLSRDQVLNVTGPLNASPRNWEERIVPIVKTGSMKKRQSDKII